MNILELCKQLLAKALDGLPRQKDPLALTSLSSLGPKS